MTLKKDAKRKCLGIYQTPEYPGYIVDVMDTGDVYEAWLGHRDYGAKMMMFGLFKNDTTYDGALCIIEGNLKHYIDLYMDEYEDLDNDLSQL